MIRIKPEPVTKKGKRPVTKPRRRANIVTPRHTPEKGGDHPHGQVKASVPPPAPEQRGAGRPKVHATAADRQRAAQKPDGTIWVSGSANAGETLILMELAKHQIVHGE